MAVRRVTRTIKDPDGHIVALANPDAWGEVDLEGVIWHIENRLATYYFGDADNPLELEVVKGIDGKYLRCSTQTGANQRLEELLD